MTQQERPMTRMEAHLAHLEAQRIQREAKRAERDLFMAQVQANRERVAAGETFAPPASLNDLYKANFVQMQEADRQARIERAADPYAFKGDGMTQPPHMVAAWKQEFFAARNAEYEAMYGTPDTPAGT